MNIDKTFDKHVMFCELSQRLNQSLELNVFYKKEIEQLENKISKLENKILLLESILFFNG